MGRNGLSLLLCALVVGLPFAFRRPPDAGDWKPGDPVLVVVTPHNEAIRYEFGRAFSAWHRERYGAPVRVDWRAIGGTTEIMRYLEAEYGAAFRAWWLRGHGAWVEGGAAAILDGAYAAGQPPADVAGDPAAAARWSACRDLWRAFREHDDPAVFGCRMDLFFGGGSYDHGKAHKEGLTVPPWPPDAPPAGLLATTNGVPLIPAEAGGEVWRTPAFFCTALSTFGICYNEDRLRELGIRRPPARWADLAAPAYFRQVGVGDPTKSGSLAKAFEMIIHRQCLESVRAAGYDDAEMDRLENLLAKGIPPPGHPDAAAVRDYQEAVGRGWIEGLQLVRRIGANARYFTDSASKVPIDVSAGDAAAGLAIDFYARFQAEHSKGADGRPRMQYVTPAAGSSVSADPISLLRGAEHRDVAVRFITFVLGEEGQKLWNYAPGAPGGPVKFALRRLPARRDFYPGGDAALQAAYERHRQHTVDALGDPAIDPFRLAAAFPYRPRWTGRHFNVQRQLIRAMCMDAGDELRSAWQAILANGGPDANPEAMAALEPMPDRPEPLTWESALTIGKRHDPIDYTREWTIFFRESYREAQRLAGAGGKRKGGGVNGNGS